MGGKGATPSLPQRRIEVQPAPRGRQPTWGGFLPQFLGPELCQRILGLLTSSEEPGYLDQAAAEVLSQQRQAMAGVLEPVVGGVEFEPEEIRWWTFAGGRTNATLRHALAAVGGSWQIIPDNFLIKIRGDDLGQGQFRQALSRLRSAELWQQDEFWTGVTRSLPAYRLSKLQPLMPPWVAREVLASHLLDVAGAWRWLSGPD